MKNILVLMRVKHWIKNGLVFIPIFFSLDFLKIHFLRCGLLAFLIFSLISSIVYIINDICDIENDKNHPVKKNRPLASGKISLEVALWLVVGLFIIASGLIGYLYFLVRSIFIIVVPLLYVGVNIFYSLFLKKKPIVDVALIVLGFVFRVIYGAVSISIIVSKYLYLMIIFGGFFLGFGKRRNEITQVGKQSRNVLNNYTVEFLDKNMYVAYALSMMAYTLWSVDDTVATHNINDYRFWTVPLVMLILQLYSFDIEKNSYGDPVDVLLSDKILQLLVVIYGIIMLFILYVI